jgi:hypothetical protein
MKKNLNSFSDQFFYSLAVIQFILRNLVRLLLDSFNLNPIPLPSIYLKSGSGDSL